MTASQRFTAALALLTAFAVCAVFAAGAAQQAPVLDTGFESMEGFSALTFPRIAAHTRYEISNTPGALDGLALHALANASASALIHNTVFNVYESPRLQWRWRIEHTVRGGHAGTKTGDDYAARIYVLFEYDASRASLAMRLKYAVARALYGQYPPHGSLNYIWANRERTGEIIVSPYTNRSRMLALRGAADAGQWHEEDVNMLEDYRRAFGEEPPPRARIALMSDADNTGQQAEAYFDYLRVLSK